MPSSASYYDIDAILAEEELVPSHTNLDFSLLAALDPDHSNKDNFLPENTRIKVPLWLAKSWAMKNYVRLQLPRHYGRKARERYDADPGDADLRCVCKMQFEEVVLLSVVFNSPLSHFSQHQKTQRTLLFGRPHARRRH